jgi:thioredoxin reductase (NADPH)
MSCAPIETDALVVGAGPVGLYQAFQLGLLGLTVQIVDVQPAAGGQCTALYADKPIYDLPGLPRITGQALIEQLQTQLAPLHPLQQYGVEVTALQRREDNRFDVVTSDGTTRTAAAVVIAAGVGAFQPRRLRVAGLDALEGRQVFHHPHDLAPFAGRRVIVVGGDEAALACAAALVDRGDVTTVTLMHRRDVLTGEPALLDRIAGLRADGRLTFVAAQPQAARTDADGRLTHLDVLDAEGLTQAIALDALIVCQGLSPRLGPLADWGLAMARKLLCVDAATLQTSEPGIHAVGDICTYAGKLKLIVCGFHEATLAAHAVHARLRPQAHGPLLYTTSSALLQQRLGVQP